MLSPSVQMGMIHKKIVYCMYIPAEKSKLIFPPQLCPIFGVRSMTEGLYQQWRLQSYLHFHILFSC